MPYLKWSLNPYGGCVHRCRFCFAVQYRVVADQGTQQDFGTRLFIKTNFVEVLARELQRPGLQGEHITLGTATDPYQPVEGRYRLTRGALTLLRQLSRLSDGRMLVLAADKGFAHEDELPLLQGPPPLEFHAANRCFSAMVNLDALARCFAANGGIALTPSKHFTSLNVCAFLERRKEDEFPATRRAYREATSAFGPDDLFTLMGWLNSYLESVSVAQALALLRLTRWDPTALLRLFPVIAPQLRDVGGERHDLRAAVLSTWANHYPVAPGDNALAFQCGVILLELRFHADALPLFTISEKVLGPSAATSYNSGLCALGLDRPAEALACMTRACELDPTFEPARSARARLEARA